MQVQADVDQSDIGQIKVGQPVALHRRRLPRPAVPRADLADAPERHGQPERHHLSGDHRGAEPRRASCARSMTANVTIDVATVRDVLRVPNAALRFKPDRRRTRHAGQGGDDGAAPEPRRSGGRSRSARRRGGGAVRRRGRRLAAGWPAGGRPAAAPAAAPGRPSTSSTRARATRRAQLRPVEIRTGITDGRYTQVVRCSPAS